MYSFGPTNVHVCTGYYKQVAFLHVHSEHYRLVPLHTVHVGCVPQQHKLQGHCNYAAYIMQPPKNIPDYLTRYIQCTCTCVYSMSNTRSDKEYTCSWCPVIETGNGS